MADSVASDRDLDLRNNYLRDFDTRRIYGLTLPHVYNVPRGWMPVHTPGLAILLAVPFAISGIVGARIAIIVLAGTLGWVVLSMVEEFDSATAAWMAIGLTVAVPTLLGSSQIYPDLIGGVAAIGLALFLLRRTIRPAHGAAWAAFWLVTGLLVWLHVKNIGTCVVLTAAGAALAWRARSTQHETTPLATLPLVAIGVGTLLLYQVWALGTPFGIRQRELASPFSRAAEIFLGLHLDQSQGMFLQHPLLLVGVAALPWLMWSHPRFALFWLALYGSAIVPNALELARYGGGGPVGRFGWTAEWLWIIPAAMFVSRYRAVLTRYVKPAVIAGLTYQALLAVRWLADPFVLFPHLDPPRDSLFPEPLQRWLPSFYYWDFTSYWRAGPNIAAFALILLVLAAGATLAASIEVHSGRSREVI
jgi:hypothetical protein